MISKDVVPLWVSIVMILLCAVTLVLNIVGICSPDTTVLVKVNNGIQLISIVFAYFYCLKGYKKDSAKLFKVFIILYLILSAVDLIIDIGYGFSISTIFRIINIICLLILALVKDIGKQNSFIIGIILLVSNMMCCMLVTVVIGMVEWTQIVPQVVIPIVLLIMISAKYKDKESRGSK